jgi:hypothetical protein
VWEIRASPFRSRTRTATKPIDPGLCLRFKHGDSVQRESTKNKDAKERRRWEGKAEAGCLVGADGDVAPGRGLGAGVCGFGGISGL